MYLFLDCYLFVLFYSFRGALNALIVSPADEETTPKKGALGMILNYI